MKTSIEFCTEFEPCPDGKAFALRYTTMAEVWDACPRADWLLWILEELETYPDKKSLRSFSCWCARNTPLADGRTIWDLLTDKRSKDVVEVAERFIHGEATEEELKTAAKNAKDAFYAHIGCAGDAVYAAYYTAYHASARNTGVYAADSAAYYASSAAYYAVIRSAGISAALIVQDAARKAQADYFKTIIPNPFL